MLGHSIYIYNIFQKKLMKRFAFLAIASLTSLSLCAQSPLEDVVRSYFRGYSLAGYRPNETMRADSVVASDSLHTVTVFANEAFASQPFTPQSVRKIYAGLQRIIPAPYNAYRLSVLSKGSQPIEDLIPNILREGNEDESRLWGEIDHRGNPWVRNLSLPYRVTAGLQGRHLFIWPSHGRYFKENGWRWQRPCLYCTTEDLFTQSFVFPFLFPMLERAGAVVGCPRERDWQTAEAVVDNDRPDRQGSYSETEQEDGHWSGSAEGDGFAPPSSLLNDSTFPFRTGTWRSVPAVNRKSRLATATWQPQIPRAGRYAVYVSYATRANSVPDARYTVFHRGGRTTFQVNQQMGGGTWVYLGTFEFEEGSSQRGRVVLSNQSIHRGVVTADGVRFGGGVGQTERGLAGTSGLPRFLEAARYYAQWAGAPDSLVNTSEGENDYTDDLRTRGNMLNWLAAGSAFLPGEDGGKVPFELSLALHSDAGARYDQSIYGTLAIATTHDGGGNTGFASGLSRQASTDFASLLVDGLASDLSATFGTQWTRREIWDRNYAETRIPSVPSAILEMLSHQNYTDMKYGHDPVFKFTLARSVYKSILKYVSHQHGIKNAVVQPLPPANFSAVLTEDGSHVRLSWTARTDSLEESAAPSGYVVYTKMEGGDFDNGQSTGSETSVVLPLAQGRRADYRVTAVNAGGESFPSETLTAYYAGKNSRRLLIVNAFDRLSGPAWVERGDSLGFDLDADMGVPYVSTTAFAGRQQDFTSPAGERNSGNELMGKELAGNTFDFPCVHGEAVSATGKWSFSSVSRGAFSEKGFKTEEYDVIDYIGGLQADRPYNFRHYEVFSEQICGKLTQYLSNGGSLLLSGSFIGSDNCGDRAKRNFIENVLHFSYDGTARDDSTDTVGGLNLKFEIYRETCREHYAAQSPDALWPCGDNAFSAFAYGGGQSAGVAYKGKNYRTVAMGFPFECVKSPEIRKRAMSALLDFLGE